MRQVLSRQALGKGVLTAAAASSLLSIATGAAYAHPQATAEASHSPGVLSGNSVSVPITFSPNVCGNSVDGGAALNPAFGNTCVNATGSDAHRQDREDRDDHEWHDGHAYERYLSPERAAAFERYLDTHEGRHARPAQHPDGSGYGSGEEHGSRHEEGRHAPRHAAPRETPREAPHETTRQAAPRHAAPRHQESHDGGGYGGPGAHEEECDDRPHTLPAPAPHHVPPPAHEAPAPPRPAPLPAPVEEAPRPLPAPAPAHAVVPELAETGAGRPGAAAALAAALVLGGAVLYRRSRNA